MILVGYYFLLLPKISSLLTDENYHGWLKLVTINQGKNFNFIKISVLVVTWLEKIAKVELSAVLDILIRGMRESRKYIHKNIMIIK